MLSFRKSTKNLIIKKISKKKLKKAKKKIKKAKKKFSFS